MSFAKKLTLLFSVIVLVTSVIIVYLVYTSTAHTLEEQILSKMEVQAYHTMDKIDRMLGARYARLSRFAASPALVSGRLTPEGMLRELQAFMKNSPGNYVSLSYFGVNRVRVADTSGKEVGRQHPLITYWKKLSAGMDSVVDVSMSVSQKRTILHMAMAVKDAKGSTIGYVVARSPLEAMYDTLSHIEGPGDIKAEEALQVDLVNRDGLILYSKYKTDSILRDISPDWSFMRKFVEKGVTVGSERHSHGGDAAKGEELYAFALERGYRNYNGDGWMLILNMPTSVAFAPAVQLRNRVLVILAVMSVYSFVVVALFSKSVTRPLRELSEASAKIGMGRLDTRVETGSSGEIRSLAESFNRMAENIKTSRGELIASREYTSNVLHSMHESLIVISLEGVIQSVNAATLLLLGYDEEELLGKHIGAVFGTGSALFPGIEIEELVEKGFIEDSSKQYVKKNGAKVPVLFSASMMRDAEKRITGIVCVALDNTGRREVERALRLSEERYRTLFEESKDVVFTGTLDGGALDINKAGIEFFGAESKEAFMDSSIPGYFKDPGDWDRFREGLLRAGFVSNFEAVMKGADGTEKTANMTANAIREGSGGMFAYRSIMRDVTGQKKLERRLLQARKMEAIGEFTGKMAHDFKNILTVISANSSILKTRIKDDETSMECIDLLLGSSKRAKDLLQGLLAFSRNQEAVLKPVSINGVIMGMEKLIKSVVGQGITFKTDLSVDDPTVMADAGQIEQVLMNLAANSRDAMPSGGVFSVATTVASLNGSPNSNGKHPAKYALITVSDTGAGMDDKTLERIFEPFFTTKETRKGTGLGLSIVYGIIDLHKGFINAYSEPGKGTVFQIFLPAVEAADTTTASTHETAAKVGGSETILLAEDEPGVRKTVKFILESNGYNVVEAADGAEAVEKFLAVKDKEPVSLLVFDVKMPVKNGREAYNEIKKAAPGIKAVFVSAYTEDIIDGKWIAKEKLGFVVKPFTQDELLKKVREMLDA